MEESIKTIINNTDFINEKDLNNSNELKTVINNLFENYNSEEELESIFSLCTNLFVLKSREIDVLDNQRSLLNLILEEGNNRFSSFFESPKNEDEKEILKTDEILIQTEGIDNKSSPKVSDKEITEEADSKSVKKKKKSKSKKKEKLEEVENENTEVKSTKSKKKKVVKEVTDEDTEVKSSKSKKKKVVNEVTDEETEVKSTKSKKK